MCLAQAGGRRAERADAQQGGAARESGNRGRSVVWFVSVESALAEQPHSAMPVSLRAAGRQNDERNSTVMHCRAQPTCSRVATGAIDRHAGAPHNLALEPHAPATATPCTAA